MKLKYKINPKLAGLMMVGAALSGCKMSEDFVVDGKSDNRVVIHSVAVPTDTTVLIFDGGYVQYLKSIYVGDTITFYNDVPQDELRNNVIHIPRGTLYVNGKHIYQIDAQRSMDLERRELTRQVMQTTEKTKNR